MKRRSYGVAIAMALAPGARRSAATPPRGLDARRCRLGADPGRRPGRLSPAQAQLATSASTAAHPRATPNTSSLSPAKTAREGTYGSVLDELPRFVRGPRRPAATRSSNYNGGQHFGFWPWRLVRPVLTGVPVKFDGPAGPRLRQATGRIDAWPP